MKRRNAAKRQFQRLAAIFHAIVHNHCSQSFKIQKLEIKMISSAEMCSGIKRLIGAKRQCRETVFVAEIQISPPCNVTVADDAGSFYCR